MADIVLSSSVRQNLLSLQSTADLLATTQTRLATGNKVNSALDNPTNFFTAQSLNSRASDINNLLDGIGNGVQVLQAANTGITSLQKLIDTAKSIANQSLQATVGYSQKSSITSVAIDGATADNLLGTTGAPVDATYAGGAADVTQTAAFVSADLAGTGAPLTVGSTGDFANSATKLSDLTDGAGVAVGPAAGDTFTVNGKTVTFGANGVPSQDANGNWTIGLDQTIGKVLSTIDTITGNTDPANASSIDAATGVVTLSTGTAADLTLSGTGLDKLGFASATDFADPTVRTGGAQTVSTTLTGATKLSQDPNGNDDALTTSFKAGDTLQINGSDAAHTLTFVTGTATSANEISITDDVATLLSKIDGLTGGTGSSVVPPVAAAGGNPAVPAHLAIHTGEGSDLKIVTSNAAAAQALGLTGTPVGPTQVTDPTVDQTLVTTFARAPGTPPALEGKTLTIAATAGGTPLNIIFGAGGSGAGQVKSLNDLNNVLAANNMQASLSTDGKLTITTSNDSASATVGAIGGTATDTGGVFSSGTGPLVAGQPVLDPVAQSTRASLVTQYNNVIDQIRTTAQDSSFNGINLLAGDQLQMTFNETGKSTLSITGVNFDPAGLGLGALTVGTDFTDNDATNKVLTSLSTASSSLRAEGSALGSNLSIVQIRQDFSKNLINVLQTGSSNLTLADTNEEAANSQALSTRQSIAVSALALANQSQQSVLQLLR
jgi:flagellin-like hook-associated protein FlgL